MNAVDPPFSQGGRRTVRMKGGIEKEWRRQIIISDTPHSYGDERDVTDQVAMRQMECSQQNVWEF